MVHPFDEIIDGLKSGNLLNLKGVKNFPIEQIIGIMLGYYEKFDNNGNKIEFLTRESLDLILSYVSKNYPNYPKEQTSWLLINFYAVQKYIRNKYPLIYSEITTNDIFYFTNREFEKFGKTLGLDENAI